MMYSHFSRWRVAGVILCLLMFCGTAFAADPIVMSVGVRGNQLIASEFILNAVETRPGEPLERNTLQGDIDAIYGQGFFTFVDVDLSAVPGGVAVVFSIMENPVVEEITFVGNTIFSSETLMQEVFTQVGTVFNRVFFRNDLDRIQDRYRRDGYVMVRVADVDIQGGRIRVHIAEPRVGDVIIQGNRRTRDHVIRREIGLESGDLFNVTRFRHQLGTLQGRGFFEDVNVGFDESEFDPDMLDLILTVQERRTQAIGINVGYGSETGLSGGLTYSDANFRGLGHIVEVGFDEGDEARYWITYSSPFMDRRTFAWRAGIAYRNFTGLYYHHQQVRQFEYDESSFSVFAGLGRRFGRAEAWSWFFTLNWRDTEYSNIRHTILDYHDDLTMWGGRNFSGELMLTLDQRVPFVPFQSGLIWETALEQAVEFAGGEYSYFKYWTQFRYFLPLNSFLDGVANVGDMLMEDNPIILAARVRAGSATVNTLPGFARYSLGGMNTLRGYRSRTFEGSNVLLGNFELRVPIQQNIELVGFYDAGNAANSMNIRRLYDNYGVGLRVRTPMGLIRLDHATGGDERRTHFGFGQMF